MAAGLLTVEQALAKIRAYARPLGTVNVPLSEALGLILAEGAASDVDSPPHDKAMMDGYAVVAGDTVAERRVIEEVMAGAVPTKDVAPGAATRIMTGAPMPHGANAVVPVEQSEGINTTTVRLPLPGPLSGKHVMARGEAFNRGEVVAAAGEIITPSLLALLAEAGHANVTVTRRPRVAALATGDELVDASQLPGAGQIRNTNGPMLTALLAEAGVEPVCLGVARDDEAAIRERVLAARDCDVLLLSGGVSAGKRDLAPGVLAMLGVEQVFHKVAVKPGKPLWFGHWARESGASTLVFGLPGNPVSGFVCFQLFVRPLLSALAGGVGEGLPRVTAELTQAVRSQGGREAFLPAVVSQASGVWRAKPTDWCGSADLRGLAAANGLIHVSTPAAGLAVGQPVITLLLPRFWAQGKQNC